MHAASRTVLEVGYAAWAARDLAGTLAQFADDVVFAIHLPTDVVPFAGEVRGRDELAQVLQEILDSYDFLAYVPEQITAQGLSFHSQVRFHYRHKLTELEYDGSMRHVWRVEDGKITRFEESTTPTACGRFSGCSIKPLRCKRMRPAAHVPSAAGAGSLRIGSPLLMGGATPERESRFPPSRPARSSPRETRLLMLQLRHSAGMQARSILGWRRAARWTSGEKIEGGDMLKSVMRVSLFAVPLVALTLPLGAAMLPGAATDHASGASTLVQKVKKHRKRTQSTAGCGSSISVTGKQRITEGLAKGSAEKAWQEKVRFAHGESFLDLANARDVFYRCSISSPTLRLKRCELIARPCRAGAI